MNPTKGNKVKISASLSDLIRKFWFAVSTMVRKGLT